MTEYRLTWVIELSADSPREAAERALEIQRDPTSIATVFDVVETADGGCLPGWTIDLTPDEA